MPIRRHTVTHASDTAAKTTCTVAHPNSPHTSASPPASSGSSDGTNVATAYTAKLAWQAATDEANPANQ